MSFNTLSIKDRLLSMSAWDGECLMWTGSKHPRGYGIIRHNGKRSKAYRVSYEVHHGLIPDGMVVMHACDRPGCINPAHLSLGSQLDNVRDMYSKGRENRPKGENHPKAKMTAAQVAEARALYIPGKYGHGAHVLAKAYGISKPAMRAILAGETYKL